MRGQKIWIKTKNKEPVNTPSNLALDAYLASSLSKDTMLGGRVRKVDTFGKALLNHKAMNIYENIQTAALVLATIVAGKTINWIASASGEAAQKAKEIMSPYLRRLLIESGLLGLIGLAIDFMLVILFAWIGLFVFPNEKVLTGLEVKVVAVSIGMAYYQIISFIMNLTQYIKAQIEKNSFKSRNTVKRSEESV